MADLRVPSVRQTKFVRLEGEFAASGVYSVRPGETLRQLLARAGGLTPDAYLYASEFTRESVRRVERQRLIEYADALEGEISSRNSSRRLFRPYFSNTTCDAKLCCFIVPHSGR
jgi:protein involved in polysaccharide export with SLBB domain